jgi:hypothetical protein
MNDYFNFCLEGLFDFESYGSGGGFHFNFYDGQPRLLVFLGLSSSGGHGSGLGSGWGIGMKIGAKKGEMYQGDQDKERSPIG